MTSYSKEIGTGIYSMADKERGNEPWQAMGSRYDVIRTIIDGWLLIRL